MVGDTPQSCQNTVVLPNGDLEVIYNNGNTPAADPNLQQLAVHCSPSGSSTIGTAHLNCGSSVKVGDDVTQNEPLCNFGRGPEQCVPGSFVRTNDFPRIGMRRSNGHLYAAWQDYRNGEFDIQLARSTDGGATWSPSTTVNATQDLDHYEAAVAVAPAAGGPTALGSATTAADGSRTRTRHRPAASLRANRASRMSSPTTRWLEALRQRRRSPRPRSRRSSRLRAVTSSASSATTAG